MSDNKAVEARLADLGLTSEQSEACRAVRDAACPLVVRACPGSGKTRTAAAMLALLLADWSDRHSGVAMLSFTNVAWQEIGLRLTRDLGFASKPDWPHFLGTIDAFVDQFIFLPFGHIPMGHGIAVQLVNQYNYDWVEKAGHLSGWGPQACRKNGCTHLTLRYDASGALRPTSGRAGCAGDAPECLSIKQRMVRAGFATSSDAMYWGMRALDVPGIAKALAARFPQIIIDEAQDTSDVQMAIINRLHAAGARPILIGDPDQAIYAFNEARPDLFEEAASRWPSLQLTTNFRSTQAICDATHRFSSMPDPARAGSVERRAGDVRPFVVRYDKSALGGIAPWFRSLISSYGIAPSCSVILARSGALRSRLLGASDWPSGLTALSRTLATATRERDRGALAEAHDRVMHALLRICFDCGSFGVHYGAIAEIGIREWRAGAWELLHSLPDASVSLRQWGPLARAAVRDALDRNGWPCAIKLGSSLRSFGGEAADEPVGSFGDGPADNDICCTTIHQAKGCEYDAVMVVCSSGGGGHRADLLAWLDPTGEEAEERRIGYVAMTRARRVLAVAVPDNRDHRAVLGRLSDQFEVVPSPIPSAPS